ncbi:MAG TPA: hypothetical protein DCX07_10290 [Phycisphaerales bacterium]|nr:hypothetical protein [Phycisphaerales bacterium]
MLSIRTKLISLLTAVALLPLLGALAIIILSGTRLRHETFGQAIQSVAASDVAQLQVLLVKDIEKVLSVSHEQAVIEALLPAPNRLGLRRLEELDAAWPFIPLTDPRMEAVLKHPVAGELKLVQRVDPRLRELFVTDRYGQLVAATGRTTDFYQADEAWWQGAYHEGKGRVYVPPVAFDESSGVWSVDLCVPISHEGQVIGVVKAVLDVTSWVGAARRSVEDMTASLMLVQRDGRILYREKTAPLEQVAEEWYGPVAEGQRPGWRVTSAGIIQGFAPIELPRKVWEYDLVAPPWSVVLCVPRGEAMEEIYRLSAQVLTIGLGLIGTLFVAGLAFAERSVVGRIRRLERAAQRVARGELSYRIEPGFGRRLRLGHDELDELAAGFNNMVQQVEQSHRALSLANEMKMNFLRVAGHELRTPVAYIMGMANLLKNSRDADKLLASMAAIGDRAKRLSDIIQAMFKLLAEQRGGRQMTYTRIPLGKLLEEVYTACNPFVEKRRQRLMVEVSHNVPDIYGDWAKLADCVENLVLNAIRFTPDGGVVKIRAENELGGYVAVSVQDQGPGIPEADLPHIFDPFFIGQNVLQHSTGTIEYGKQGMGLGLTIVRHFVEMHGGRVRVNTGPHGSTFTISIPVQPPIATEARVGLPPEPPAPNPDASPPAETN